MNPLDSNLFPRAPVLVYALYCGRLYGTERMALATLDAMRAEYRPILAAPPGPVHAAARDLGIASIEVTRAAEIMRIIRALLRVPRQVAVITASLPHALATEAGAIGARARLAHVHVVHGGMDERTSYGKKKWVARLSAPIVAVSAFVRDRLIAHGVPEKSITVCPNFLARERIAALSARPRTPREHPTRILAVGRLERPKRLDLLIRAASGAPRERPWEVVFVGDGAERGRLAQSALDVGVNASFPGFIADPGDAYARGDVFVHTAADEPFGLVVLEAMAAGLPVLVPDRGGAAEIVDHGVNGFRYRSGDARDLECALAAITRIPPEARAAIGRAATRTVIERYSPARGRSDYARVLATAAGRKDGNTA